MSDSDDSQDDDSESRSDSESGDNLSSIDEEEEEEGEEEGDDEGEEEEENKDSEVSSGEKDGGREQKNILMIRELSLRMDMQRDRLHSTRFPLQLSSSPVPQEKTLPQKPDYLEAFEDCKDDPRTQFDMNVAQALRVLLDGEHERDQTNAIMSSEYDRIYKMGYDSKWNCDYTAIDLSKKYVSSEVDTAFCV